MFLCCQPALWQVLLALCRFNLPKKYLSKYLFFFIIIMTTMKWSYHSNLLGSHKDTNDMRLNWEQLDQKHLVATSSMKGARFHGLFGLYANDISSFGCLEEILNKFWMHSCRILHVQTSEVTRKCHENLYNKIEKLGWQLVDLWTDLSSDYVLLQLPESKKHIGSKV